MIDYIKFIKRVQCMNQEAQKNMGIEYIANYLNKYLDENNMAPEDFLPFLCTSKEDRKMQNIDDIHRLKIYVFAKLAANKIFPSDKKILIMQNAHIIDIDKDGFIDKYDLDTFLNRYHYLD